MAKSIRSKWKRKCRAVKRERYAKKELERLKKTLGIDDKSQTDVSMQEVATLANDVTEQQKEKARSNQVTSSESMETNERIYNPKTLRDQHGSYPVWVHPRKIVKKQKGKKKKAAVKNKKN